MKVYLIKTFRRFQRKERLSEAALMQAVDRAEEELIDADLGGGLIKQRIAREGKGRRGGYRTISPIELGSGLCFSMASPRTSARTWMVTSWRVGRLWGGSSSKAATIGLRRLSPTAN